MARRKISPCAAKRTLEQQGVNFDSDFHALPRMKVARIVAMAKKAGYRKRRDAPGSTGRMYFQYLKRTRCRR